MNLEYDPAKNASNMIKHGISLKDAMLVYNAADKITLKSRRNDEDRLMDVAMVQALEVVLVLVYVIRGNKLRAISLRHASQSERRLYESERDGLDQGACCLSGGHPCGF